MSPSLELDENGVWYGYTWNKKKEGHGFQNLSVGIRGANDMKKIYSEAAEKLGLTVDEITAKVNAGEKIVWK